MSANWILLCLAACAACGAAQKRTPTYEFNDADVLKDAKPCSCATKRELSDADSLGEESVAAVRAAVAHEWRGELVWAKQDLFSVPAAPAALTVVVEPGKAYELVV